MSVFERPRRRLANLASSPVTPAREKRPMKTVNLEAPYSARPSAERDKRPSHRSS